MCKLNHFINNNNNNITEKKDQSLRSQIGQNCIGGLFRKKNLFNNIDFSPKKNFTFLYLKFLPSEGFGRVSVERDKERVWDFLKHFLKMFFIYFCLVLFYKE